MSSAATTVKQEDEFATPARPELSENILPTSKDVVPKPSSVSVEANVLSNQVTPLDPQKETEAIRATVTTSPTTMGKTPIANKQVRFDGAKVPKGEVLDETTVKEEEKTVSASSGKDGTPTSPVHQKQHKRGLVSRRGGRYGGSRSPPEPVTEYKTYRSPSRKAHEEEPSLCSSHGEAAGRNATEAAPTSSISCDPSMSTASPLAATAAAAVTGEKTKTHAETPTRGGGSGGGFQTLPNLDDAKMIMSPGGAILLSPTTPNRPGPPLAAAASNFFEGEKTKSAISPRMERERAVQTPTDFSLDYGKNQNISGGSFDTSNVLAWLQSPTANGLFSPGGYGSILNTPGGGGGPRTPRTPTVSTSFFFSDVASLPHGEEASTPNNNKSKEDGKRKGISNIICISPLASSKARTGSTPLVNLKDVFASPQEKNKIRSLPLLQDSSAKDRPLISQRSGSKDPSVDAVHLAERDLMEDEDMSVLLQLASNTPRGGSAAGPVFRSPNPSNKQAQGVKKDENLPALQLPMIGGQEGNSSRKSRAGDDAFAPPQLGMRSGSGSSKEIVAGKGGKDKKSDKGDSDKKAPARSYPMHPPYPPHREGMPYYPMNGMPPGMPPGGTMRVSIGGTARKGSPPRPGMGNSPHAPPGHYPDYPFPPPPGMYSQYGHGPPPPMGYPPYQGHFPHPPPRHMPMYGAQQQHPPPPPHRQQQQQQQPSSSGSAKKSRSTKKCVKRGSPLLDTKTPKKPRKSPSTSSKKKKPQASGERQKPSSSARGAGGGKNDRAATLAAAILRGVTMRPSGKWQAQLYFAGKSRYIGVFDTREKAALAYEIAREKLKSGPQDASGNSTENLVTAARKAAFEGVNERFK